MEVPLLTMEQIHWVSDTSFSNKTKSEYGHTIFAKKKYSKQKGFAFVKDTIYPQKKLTLKFPVDINSADSASLVALPKIGPFMAGKIVDYRKRLGGFHSLQQLCEIWGFKEDFLYDLEGKIWVDPKYFFPISINFVEFEELKQHPYFKFTLSRAIINYRNQHGNYKNIHDLKTIKIVNDSILSLIKPYLKF